MEKSNPSQGEQENGCCDFSSARHYLDLAEKARKGDDEKLFLAARKMIMVCLGIKDENHTRWKWPR